VRKQVKNPCEVRKIKASQNQGSQNLG